MFFIAKLGLSALSVAFFMMNRPSAGRFFLGLGIIGLGMDSSGVAHAIFIAAGVLLIVITVYVWQAAK